MLAFGGKRLEIWTQLSDPYDYDSFVARCLEAGVIPLTVGEFAQKVGMLMTAKRRHPELSARDAYEEFIAIVNAESNARMLNGSPTAVGLNQPYVPCGGCDGGPME